VVLGPIHKYFFEIVGPCSNFSKRIGTASQFTSSSGVPVQDLRNLMNFGIFLQRENPWTGSTVTVKRWCSRVHSGL
jgi:hypothetical protein